MTTYNTGNPIGSTAVKDLYDNAENLDTAVNDTSRDAWSDRLGRSRKTMSGMEREFNADQASRDNRFNTFIASSGYQFLGDYAAGIEITEYNQIIRDSDGEFWRLSGQVGLPYTTTGAGLPEDDSLTPLGDAVLRQELASPDMGAAMVAYGDRSAADRLNELGDDNFSRIASLSRSGNLRLAIVGDSTAAGVGAGGGAYGECNPDAEAGYSMFWYWSLINSDPAFVGASETSEYYRRSYRIDVASLPSVFPCYNFRYSDNPSTDNQELVYPRGTAATDRLTIYYGERTSNAAALFDVVISDATTGAELARHTVDTYVSPVNFGSAGTFNVGSGNGTRLTKTTVTLPASVSKVMVRIENISLADRGAGMPANGSADVYGFALGEGVLVRNFAVSSTTLLNNSAANISRGVTTTERLQKCYDMNANAIIINWGTNDSKPGISTVDEFKSSLSSRIDELRAFNPGISIVLATTATGAAGTIYENNVLYFEAIREVASKKLCGLLDGQRIIRQLPRVDVVKDDVHPNERGYQLIADALGAKSGSRSPRPKSPSFKKTGYFIKPGEPGTSDFSGDFVLLADIPIGRASRPSQLVASARLNLFREGAEIVGCELGVSFSNAPGIVNYNRPRTAINVPRVPGDTGDALGVIVDEKVFTSSTELMAGPYYLKVWAKNFGLRISTDALRVLWRYEEL